MSNSLHPSALEELAASFRWNAEHVLHDSAPLYEKLAYRIADDGEMLALAAHAPAQQPAMNLFFGAVHYLLLRGTDDPLTIFFPDLVRKPNTQDDPYPIFRAFCLEHAAEIAALISTRRVQTNEVGRCALFLPALALIARRLNGAPFALLEVGASAGLNLNFDQYAYAYGDGIFCGDRASPIWLTCELRGARRPNFSAPFPQVVSRVGIDLNPNDVFDDDAMLWLRALVWAEQRDRAERLQRAIALARQFPPRVLQGDALELLPQVMRELPRAVPLVLFHSFVLYQFEEAARANYYRILNGTDRAWFDLAIEPQEFPASLILTTQASQETLARCHFHGRWLEWIYDDTAAV